MHIRKPSGTKGRVRPRASARHRSRWSMMELLRRDYGGDPTITDRADLIAELSAPARRDLRGDSYGVVA